MLSLKEQMKLHNKINIYCIEASEEDPYVAPNSIFQMGTILRTKCPVINRDPLFQVNLQVSQTKSGEWRCSGVVAGRVPPATAP